MSVPLAIAGIVGIVGCCWLKLHIMRNDPGHPNHEQVCRDASCICRREGRQS